MLGTENETIDENHWSVKANREFEAAPTRAEKLAVLKRYYNETEAEEAIGLILGEHSGDRVDVSGGNFGKSS